MLRMICVVVLLGTYKQKALSCAKQANSLVHLVAFASAELFSALAKTNTCNINGVSYCCPGGKPPNAGCSIGNGNKVSCCSTGACTPCTSNKRDWVPLANKNEQLSGCFFSEQYLKLSPGSSTTLVGGSPYGLMRPSQTQSLTITSKNPNGDDYWATMVLLFPCKTAMPDTGACLIAGGTKVRITLLYFFLVQVVLIDVLSLAILLPSLAPTETTN
jgi:hypothetical protein